MNATPSECSAAIGFIVSLCSWVSNHFSLVNDALSFFGLVMGFILALASLFFQIRRDRRDRQKHLREQELHNMRMRKYEDNEHH